MMRRQRADGTGGAVAAPSFVNWAGTVRSQPRAWHHPDSVEAVQEVVAGAAAAGRRVKVVGSGHSWSAIAAGEDQALSLGRLARILEVDAAAGTVVVDGGVTLRALNDALAREGLALPILGSIDAQTLSGAIATGTHGSSLRHGNLGTGVVAAELVDGRGERVLIPEGDPRLNGVRVHLGALGVVTRLTLRVVPAFRLQETRRLLPFEQALEELPCIAARHSFVKLWWLPHTERVWVVSLEPTEEPGGRGAVSHALDVVANKAIFPPLLAVGARVPAAVPWINGLVAAVHFTEGKRVARSDHLFTLPMPPRHRETELALPLDRAAQALRWCRDWIVGERARIGFITEVRFVRGDESWMSPAYGQDVCQFGVYAGWEPDASRFFEAFRAAGEAWGGRPHWGKELSVSPDEVTRWYPRAEAFRALALRLDPRGTFRNALLDRALGPVMG
jgi:FAD/FMN-containing dehydrogenase